MVIEGMLALTGQHFIIDYNERMGTLPGFVEGFSNVARDEHRHVAFGVRFLTDMRAARTSATARRSSACSSESLPVADGVLDPPWAEEEDLEIFGFSREETSRVRGPEPHPPAQGDRAGARYRRLTLLLGRALRLDFGAAWRFFGAE